MPDGDQVKGSTRTRAGVDSSADAEAGDEVAAATQEIRKRDSEFWYEDGTVILVARDVEFRIYKGLLAAHSSVFRDMFSIPQPPSSTEIDSGPCPVVHLSDSPEDIRHVLRIYLARGDHSPFTTFTPEDPSIDLISACIRLGHKYQMARLLEHAIAYLKIWYPADMATWQKHTHYAAAIHAHYVPLGFNHVHAIGVVNLARLIGEPSLLLPALLDCSSLEERLLHGFDRADGTHEELAPEDLRRCLMARFHLATAGVSIFVRAFGGDVSGECTTTQSCRKAFRKALVRVDDFARDLVKCDPFKPLRRLDIDGISLCSHCLDAAMERAREKQEGIWKDLPGIFDVEVEGWSAS